MRNPICLIKTIWDTLRHAPAGTWLDGCDYVEEGTYKDCTVTVLKCERCGAVSIGWVPQVPSQKFVEKAIVEARVDQCGHVAQMGTNPKTGELAPMAAFINHPETYGKSGMLTFEYDADARD